MSDNYGVPITYVSDPPVATGAAIVQGGTIATTGLGGGPVMAYIVGGTIGASFSFVGSVTTDIGNVKIEDADDNYGTIPAASLLKIPSTNALVVQHIDDTGTPLRESTQFAIRVNGSNTNETLANIDLNTMAAATYLAEIAATQGTQSTATLVTIASQQGTQATSALQAAGNSTLITILNAQGTMSTAGLAQNSTLAQVVNNQGTQATSALQSSILKEMQQPGYRDAFGRARVSEPYCLFDSKLMIDSAPNFWDDQQVSGTGTSSTFDKPNAKVRLAVSNNTAGARQRQTFRRFNYQPGKSQQILMTFVLGAAATGITRRVGYFSDYNGIYLEQTSTGARFVIRKNGINTETYEQANWNVDKLDGNGPSGLLLDLTKTQIMWVDFEWLGVGSVRMGFVISATFVMVNVAHHANTTQTDVYMTTPNLPMRYELINSGAGAASTLDCICASVTVEGGSQHAGLPRSIDRGATPLTTANDTNLYPILGLRLSAAGTNVSIQPTHASMICTSTAFLRYAVMMNPTLAGNAPTWNSVANSGAEFSNTTTNATTVVANTGTIVASGYANSAAATLQLELPSYFSLGVSISGVRDEVWLCGTRVTGTAEALYAALQYTEQ